MMDRDKLCETLLAKMGTDKEDLMAKLDTKRKTDKEDFLAKMEANKEELKADKEDFMAKLDADRRAVKEEREADRRDLEEWMKMMTANQAKTDAKVTELTEEIGKTKTELQTVQVSLSARANKLQEDPGFCRERM
jgi:hypothetical protein